MKIRLALAAAAVLFVGMLGVTPASAQYAGGTPPAAGPVAGATVEVQGVTTPVEVDVEVGRRVGISRFALTGADIAQMVVIGAVLVLGGAVLVHRGRRRPAPSSS